MADEASPFRTKLEALAKLNPRYLWLLHYLESNPFFCENHLHPIAQGRTQCLVADIRRNSKDGMHVSSFSGDRNDGLHDALSVRGPEVGVRLVFVTSVSGVGDKVRTEQLSKSSLDVGPSLGGAKPPIWTTSRTAGVKGNHPIAGHGSFLPDAHILTTVSEVFDLDPELLLQFLDQNAHLTYTPQCGRFDRGTHHPVARVAIDQGNHFSAVIVPYWHDKGGFRTKAWTVLLLAAEDNSLGINFDSDTPAIRQPFRPYTATVAEAFQAEVQALSTEERRAILSHPAGLIGAYAQSLVQAFSCHLCLLQDEWKSLYEPHAYTSVAFGDANHRNDIRRLSREYVRHAEYIECSIRNLEHLTATRSGAVVYSRTLDPVIADLNYFLSSTYTLKNASERFLEQQVSIEETRISIVEARDLKRLSYLAFIFVPLSLASSWFGMNVDVLDGSTPVWVSVVTSIGVLMFSMAFMGLTTSHNVREAWERARSFVRLSGSNGEDTHLGEHDEDSALVHSIPQLSAINPNLGNVDGTEKFLSLSMSMAQPVNPSPSSTGTEPGNKIRVEAPTPSQPISPGKALLSHQNSDRSSELKRHKNIPANDTERRKQRSQKQRTPHNRIPYVIRSQYEDPPSGSSTPQPTSPPATATATATATAAATATTTTATVAVAAPTIASLESYLSPAQHRPKRKPPTVARLPAETKQTSYSTEAESRAEAAPSLPPLNAPTTADGPSDSPHTAKMTATYPGASPTLELVSNPNTGRRTMSTVQEDPAESTADSDSRETVSDSGDGTEPERGSGSTRKKSSALYQAVIEGDKDKILSVLQLEDDDPGRGEQYLIVNALWEASRARSGDGVERIIRAVAESDHRSSSSSSRRRRQPEAVCCSALVEMWDSGVGANNLIPVIPSFCVVVVELLDRIGRRRPGGREDGAALVQPGSAAHGAACRGEFLAIVLDEAAQWGNDSLVRYLLKNDKDKPTVSTLVAACRGGHETVMRTLLDAGVDLTISNHNMHPLKAIPPDMSLARMLLAAGAKVDSPEVLVSAARHGSIPFLEFLMATAADIDLSSVGGLESLTDGFWHEAINGVLTVAADKGDGDMVRWLLMMGVDLNVGWKLLGDNETRRDRRPRSPEARLRRGEEILKQACGRGCNEIVSILLDAGVAGELEQDPGGASTSMLHVAMNEACRGGNADVMETLLRTGRVDPNHELRFLYWVAGGISDSDVPGMRAKAAKLLLQWGARIDGVDEDSSLTPLHRALMADEPGDPEVVEVLLEHGANVMPKSTNGSRIPLHTAAARGNTSGIRLLLKWGAELEARGKDGETPLHTAARAGKVAAVSLLLDHGANIDARDAGGWTPVHRAAWNKHKTVVKLLAARNADMNLETTAEGLQVKDFLDLSGDEGGGT